MLSGGPGRTCPHANYSLARSFIRSPEESLRRLVAKLNRSIEDSPLTETASSILLQKADIENYVEDVRHLFEVLVGAGETKEAARLQTIAIETVVSSVIRSQVKEQLY